MRTEANIEVIRIVINNDATGSLRTLAAETHFKKNLLFIPFPKNIIN